MKKRLEELQKAESLREAAEILQTLYCEAKSNENCSRNCDQCREEIEFYLNEEV